MLARSSAEDVVVVSVVPAPWPPNPYRGDKEYLAYQEDHGGEVHCNRARHATRRQVPLGAEFLVRRAESAPAGLLQIDRGAAFSSVVVGSSSMGLLGRVMLGGVCRTHPSQRRAPDRRSPSWLPCGPATSVTRVSVAFGRADHDRGLVARAASMARELGAALRVVCFAVRPMRGAGRRRGGASRAAGDGGMDAAARGRHRRGTGLRPESRHRRCGRPATATRVDTALGQGSSWADGAPRRSPGLTETCSSSASAADHSAVSSWAPTRPRSSGTHPCPWCCCPAAERRRRTSFEGRRAAPAPGCGQDVPRGTGRRSRSGSGSRSGSSRGTAGGGPRRSSSVGAGLISVVIGP